jgi:glycosyltransferase involved in cell wall biosynthesis
MRSTPRILFVYSRPARFVEIDRDLLRERWRVREWAQPGRFANPLRVLVEVARADAVVGWFASWHTFWPITFARLLRKPSLLIVGGFDTASVPEIGYGYQRGGAARRLSRWIMFRATRLLTNSEASRREIETNVGLAAERVTVAYHGVPDPFGELPTRPRERLAVTVGNVAWLTFERKGLRAFVRAAALLPDVQFVVAGRWLDRSVDLLRELGAPNVAFTDGLPRAELDDLLARASVYVQASVHEGFGLSLAEAMLAGCIPVVTSAGSLPEVVGDVGVQVEDSSPAALGEAIARAFELGDEERRRARERILHEFPVDARRAALHAEVEALLAR